MRAQIGATISSMLISILSLAAADPLPDLASTTRRMSCTAPPIATGPHPGAEQFYTGAFTIDESGAVSGVERKYLYGNAAWKSKTGLSEGEDCKDVWTVTGKRVPAADCSECAFAIEIQAVIDPSRSSCRTRNASDASRYKGFYNVLVEGTQIELRFKSGKPIGKGRVEGETYSWLGDQTCRWF